MTSPQRITPKDLARQLAGARDVITTEWAVRNRCRHVLRAGIAEGALAKVLPAIYTAKSVQNAPQVRLRAASVWSEPYGALGGTAAAHIWGIVDTPPVRVSVVLPPQVHRECPPWVRPCRPATSLDVVSVRGMRLVEPDHAVVQAWNELRGADAIEVVVAAVQREKTTPRAIAEVAGATPRVRARKELAKILTLLRGGVKSYLEYFAKTRVFTARRFPQLEWQAPFLVSGTDRFVDAYDPEAMLALEFDSYTHHASDVDRQSDVSRDAEFAALGVQTLRFTFKDIVRRPQWCIDAYLAARRARLLQLHGTDR